MKRLILNIIVLCACTLTAASPLLNESNAKKQVIDGIEPQSWFVGMVNTQLQLLVNGKDINFTELVGTDNPKVQVTSVVHPNSPNYLIVYLDVSCAEAGDFNLYFRRNNKDEKYTYTLRQRNTDAQMRTGLNNTDALYATNDQPQFLRQKLDDIEALGATAISLSGDAVSSTYDEWVALTQDCHARSMKVVCDINLNNTRMANPICSDVPMVDWFNGAGDNRRLCNKASNAVRDPYASKHDAAQAEQGWLADSLPDYNLTNPHVARYIVQQAKWMIENCGCDGIGLSGIAFSDQNSAMACLKELHSEYPDMNLFATDTPCNTMQAAAWQTDTRIKGQLGQIDMPADHVLSKAIRAVDINTVYNTLACDFIHRTPAKLIVDGNYESIASATLALTLPRTPLIRETSNSAVCRLMQWRKNSKAVTRGIMTHFTPDNGVYAYLRRYGDQRVLVLINSNAEAVHTDMARFAEVTGSAQSGRDVTTQRTIHLNGEATLQPHESLVVEF